jgi:exodeoxyribonuclease III
MRIISYNVNGIRSAINKGFIEWLATNPADVICLQETKAQPENINVQLLEDLGFIHNWYSAQKKGYSGVAIFSKQKPDYTKTGTGHAVSDEEGRVIQIGLGDLQIINAYFPSGTSGDVRQTYKYQWLGEMYTYLQELKKTHPKIVLCGDYNIAHKEIDIHDPKGNKNNSGFLPEERAWMDNFLANGWVDTFRHVNKEPHHYSWWSQRFPSVRLQNKGWRIDYITVTEALQPHIKQAAILPDVKHSDHCPVYLELDDVYLR